ncbi:MAG TPA: YciI family protein [Streptosporangiaceae bacterium]
MKYMLLICGEPTAAGADEQAGDDDGPTIEEWLSEMERRGVRLLGERLRPPEDATTVRVRHGELLTTDGPYAETKEWLAGFDIIDCADLDEAIEVASKHPVARHGMVEVRPFWTFEP